MNAAKSLLSVLIPTVLLFSMGCDDSKNPLSDPKNSKADERLIGIWVMRHKDGETYFHVGLAGDKLPAGVLRLVQVNHTEGKVISPSEYLAFSTAIDGKSYLNLVYKAGEVKSLNKEGWKANVVASYKLFRYQFDGDKLLVYVIDDAAETSAIKDGKVKGVAKPNHKSAEFTDSTENVARFVAKAGDSLWNTKEPLRFNRVTVGKKK